MSIKELADLYLTGPEYVVSDSERLALADFVTGEAHRLFQATGYTWSIDPAGPDDFITLVDTVNATHNVGISPSFDVGPVLSGWLNIQFRAWHDLIHVLTGNTFSVWGEANQAWLHVQATTNDLFAKLFINEVLLPAAAYTAYGPDDKRVHRAVMVSDEWLQAFRLYGPEAIHMDYTNPAPVTPLDWELTDSALAWAQTRAGRLHLIEKGQN